MAIGSRRNARREDGVNYISIEDRLALNKYDVDEEAHIKVNGEICSRCEHHACLYICPAECYTLREGHISFSYEGCLECGSCQICCDEGAIEWNYPRGGFGICFEYG